MKGEGTSPAPSEQHARQLARQRAEAVKHYLVTQHRIDAARLAACLPEIDTDKKARPRVELLI